MGQRAADGDRREREASRQHLAGRVPLEQHGGGWLSVDESSQRVRPSKRVRTIPGVWPGCKSRCCFSMPMPRLMLPRLIFQRSPEMSGNGPLTHGALPADRSGKAADAWRQSALGAAASPTPRNSVSRLAWRARGGSLVCVACMGWALAEVFSVAHCRRCGCHETRGLLHVPPRLLLPLPHRCPSFQLARHFGLQHWSALLLRCRQAAGHGMKHDHAGMRHGARYVCYFLPVVRTAGLHFELLRLTAVG